jgi:hypothetical protein
MLPLPLLMFLPAWIQVSFTNISRVVNSLTPAIATATATAQSALCDFKRKIF